VRVLECDRLLALFIQGVTLLRSGGLLIASNSNTSNVTGLYQCTAAFPSAGGQIVTVASYNVQYSEGKGSLCAKCMISSVRRVL
jgi:hypothetical protein